VNHKNPLVVRYGLYGSFKTDSATIAVCSQYACCTTRTLSRLTRMFIKFMEFPEFKSQKQSAEAASRSAAAD